MSKRDDDSQADMEVGMTTAERRRRRRRGGGLRVPSDNVPRRSNPPVVAPVPEDPSLAMSIAYSFSSDASEPMNLPDGTDQRRAPPGDGEAMPTVIDPISAPIEQQDFEMKTREMSAVDLEALGLVDPASRDTASTQPMAPMDGSSTSDPGLPGVGVEVRFRKPEPPRTPRAERSVAESDALAAIRRRPSSVEVELDLGEGGTTLDEPVIDDGDEATSISPPPSDPKRRERLKTVALSDDDLEEVREAVRASSLPIQAAPPAIPSPPSTSTSQGVPVVRLHPPTPAPTPRAHTPTPPPPVAGALSALVPPPPPTTTIPPPTPSSSASQPIPPLGTPPPPPTATRPSATSVAQSAATELWGEKPTRPPLPKDPPSTSQPMAPVVPLAPLSTIPPPVKSSAKTDDGWTDASSSTQPLSPSDLEKADEPLSVPEIDIQELADRAENSGEFEVSIEDADEIKTTQQAAAAKPAERKRERPPSVPPPVAPAPASTQPGVPPPAPSGTKDHGHHPPPPPPAAHQAKPPAPPPVKAKEAPPVAPAAAKTQPVGKAPRGKPWFIDLFDEDYLRTLPFLTPQATQAEAEFVSDAMGLTPGAQVLDVGCGYGRHAMELAARGFHVVGLDLSTPLLVRGGEEAQRRGLQINFVRGDMRELDFEGQFDGAYCLFSTFGYFDDETNKKTIANIARALKPGGRVLIEILNRDYVIADLPTRVWWEGDGCVVLEEVELNYFSSRIQVNRSVVFDDGRQLEQEISVRAYSLHEVGKLMHAAGFRVLEVSGGYQTRGRFFGNQSRHIIVLAERKETAPSS